MAFGEPVDPRYLEFKDGFEKWIIGRPAYPYLRWKPGSSDPGWYVYSLDKNDHLDVGFTPGPESPLQLDYRSGLGNPSFKLKDTVFGLPRLYEQIDARLASFGTYRSTAVWNPWNGAWRVIRPKPAQSPLPKAPKPDPSRPHDLPAEFYVKMAQLRKLRDDRIITDEEYDRRVDALLEEYI